MTRVAFLLVALAPALAAADGLKAVAHDKIVAQVPAEWSELPEVAARLRGPLVGDAAGGVAVHGDAPVGVMAAFAWVARDGAKAVRPEIAAFHAAHREQLEKEGKVLIYEPREAGRWIVARYQVEVEGVKVVGFAQAAVDNDMRLRAYLVQCGYAAPRARRLAKLCDQVVASFTVSVRDAELKPLEVSK